MTVQTIDDLWFSTYPGCQFRLRRLTRAEMRNWPIPPDCDCTWWGIVRRADGQMQKFGAGPSWAKAWTDEELALFLSELAAPIAGAANGIV